MSCVLLWSAFDICSIFACVYSIVFPAWCEILDHRGSGDVYLLRVYHHWAWISAHFGPCGMRTYPVNSRNVLWKQKHIIRWQISFHSDGFVALTKHWQETLCDPDWEEPLQGNKKTCDHSTWQDPLFAWLNRQSRALDRPWNSSRSRRHLFGLQQNIGTVRVKISWISPYRLLETMCQSQSSACFRDVQIPTASAKTRKHSFNHFPVHKYCSRTCQAHWYRVNVRFQRWISVAWLRDHALKSSQQGVFGSDTPYRMYHVPGQQ